MNTITGMSPHRPIVLPAATNRQLRRLIAEFSALAALLIAVVSAIHIDVRIFANNLSEVSVTEGLQSALVLGSAIIFAWRAWRDISARGYLMAVATLLACMFVRENDAALDHIHHGFWAVPAGIIAFLGGACVWCHRDSVTGPLVRHFDDRQTGFILIGFLLLLVFSRLFGTSALWQSVMGDDYTASFKTVVQEGLELLGYALIAYGTLLSVACRARTCEPWMSSEPSSRRTARGSGWADSQHRRV